MLEDITVLMTGAGAPGAPGILRCYRNNGERNIRVIGADIKKRVSTICNLDGFFQIPRPTAKDFCEQLLKITKQENVQVIQPLVTKELEVLSAHRSMFEECGIKVCCAELKHLEIANDKGKLLRFMSEHQMAVPKFYIVHTVEEFKQACERLGYPEKAICFKPTVGNGSRGFRIIDEKKNLYDLIFQEKPNSTYISMEQIVGIFEKASELPELLVMEFLPEDEYSVDVLADSGKTLVAIPRKRLQMNGGISTDCVIENQPDIIEYCRKIVAALSLDGNIGIQVRADENGVYKILEINPRVQGSIVACAAAGANLPYLAIKKALGEPIGDIHVKWGTEMIRHWNEVYYDDAGLAFTY